MSAGIVDRVRQPEYTGENRCMPCTIANSVIAVGLAGAVGAGLAVGVGAVAAALGSVAVLAASAASIWLRGYLVPYTPYITKNYFPEFVLAWFDKVPEDDTGDAEVDPEGALLEAGAVEECAQVDDLCLSEGFRREWRAGIERIRESGYDTEDLVTTLDLDERTDAANLARHGNGVLLQDGARELGKWESDAAVVADLAAAEVLADRYDRWADLDPFDRSAVLRGLRIFAEDCPLCDSGIDLGQETVESCCRSYDVVAVACRECGSRLFEQRMDDVGGADADSGGDGGATPEPV